MKSIFFKAKTKRDPNLQNTLKNLKKRKKIIARMGVEPVTRAVQSENRTAEPRRQ